MNVIFNNTDHGVHYVGAPEDTTRSCYMHQPAKVSPYFGAVCVADGRFSSRRAEKFCAESFLAFLKDLITRRRKGRKMIVVLDNARYHHAKMLAPWLKKHRKQLRLDFLPPYSPDLNPTERVWKLTRRLRTHNQYFPLLQQLVDSVFGQFERWNKPNDTLRRLCAII